MTKTVARSPTARRDVALLAATVIGALVLFGYLVLQLLGEAWS